jgi:hypothetical protein
MWGAVSDERTGLSFKIPAGPRQRSHSRDHILLSQIRDFSFRRLLRLEGLRWRYSTPPPHGKINSSQRNSSLLPFCKDRTGNTVSNNPNCFVFTDPLLREELFYCRVRIRCPGNVFTDPLPNNGRLL